MRIFYIHELFRQISENQKNVIIMKSLSNDEMLEIQGGRECFMEAMAWEFAWDAYFASPSGTTYAMVVISFGALSACMAQQ